MAEICFDCYKKIYGNNEKRWRYVISRDLDLCEECGEYKRVIVCECKIIRYIPHVEDVVAAIKILRDKN